MKKLLIIFILLVIPSWALAVTYYIRDNSGIEYNTDATGCAYSGLWTVPSPQDIEAVFTVAGVDSYATIHLCDGTYSGTELDSDSQLDVWNTFTITGNGDTSIITSTGVYTIDINDKSEVTVENLNIQGGTIASLRIQATADNTSTIVVDNNSFNSSVRGIYGIVQNGYAMSIITLSNNTITSPSNRGINMWVGSNPATGTHDGSDNVAVLSDSGASFGSLTGQTITNRTDSSYCTITSNTSTTVTCSGGLAGGGDNDWDIGDFYSIHTLGTLHTVAINTNTITNSGNMGIAVENQSGQGHTIYGIDINGNTIDSPDHVAIYIGRVNSTPGQSYIRNNSIPNGAGDDTDQINGIRLGAANGIIIENNTIIGPVLSDTSGDGYGIILDTDSITTPDDIASKFCDSVIVRNNYVKDMTDAGGSGIHFGWARNSSAYSNLVINCRRGIVFRRATGIGNFAYHNTFVNITNGCYTSPCSLERGVGISVNNGTQVLGDTPIIINNIISGADECGIKLLTGGTDPQDDWNLYYDNVNNYGCGIGITPPSNDITGQDPLFVDPANDNFALQDTSPARYTASDGTNIGEWQGYEWRVSGQGFIN